MRRNALLSKDFLLVVAGQIISIFGNQIVRYALPLYLLNETGSSALFGAVLACAFLPMLVLFPVGGIIADRVNKRNIMVILDFSTALLIAAVSLLAGAISIVPLVAVTMILLYGIQGAYQPAVQASVPALLDAEHIMQGNSIVNLVTSLGSMIGPVVGGVLFSLFGLSPILYVSAVCFLASAVLEVFIRIPFAKQQASGNAIATGFKDLKGSFRFLFKERPVLWKLSLTYASVNLLLTSLFLIGLPVLITQHLGFAPDTANRLYGYAQGVTALGAVAGGLLAGAFAKRLKPTAGVFLLLGCAFSVLTGGLALQLLHAPMGVYAVLALGGGLLVALSTVLQIQIMSSIQIQTPPALTGKVIACVICICMCTNPLGQFIYGFVFAHIGRFAYLPFYAATLLMLTITIATRSVFSRQNVSRETL
ncbi:MAG: MFS transporter [Oscillospiraceae bacterium]|nr:MFS transporter [Oscillospiraceae bacterium]